MRAGIWRKWALYRDIRELFHANYLGVMHMVDSNVFRRRLIDGVGQVMQ